jgi:NAD(P)-dependent dehydrogenase (short-subunit alcohol dehydrogenase family)
MVNLLRLLYVNSLGLPAVPPPGTFSGWTVLITGATGGLGFATAAHFIRLGASRVIITARNAAKGEAAKKLLEEQTGKTGVVEVMELQMESLETTRKFVEKVRDEVESIDYVLLNAGVLNNKYKKVERDGWEESIQVNVLSSALLGLLLLPWMKIAGKGKAHLGVVTSGRHRDVDVEKVFPEKDVLEYFNKEENFPGPNSYPYSKLMQQYVVNELAKLAVCNLPLQTAEYLSENADEGFLFRPEVIVNSMCPGTVTTDLGRAYKTNFIATMGINLIMKVIFKTSEAGARTPALAALTTPEENGKYITHYMSEEDYNT